MMIRTKNNAAHPKKGSGVFGAAISVVSGALLFGVSVNMFLLPAGVVTGGASGIATAAAKIFGTPVGLGIITLNLPLFLLCIRRRGLRGMMYSIIGTAAASLASDLLFFLPAGSPDVLLCALLGGAVMGIGSGLMLTSGFTTGGSDLAAYLIHKRRPSVSTGHVVLFLDAVIIVFCAALMRNFAGIMYSVICIFSYSAAIDMVQSVSRRAKMVFVVSSHSGEIASAVSETLERGVTLLSGSGFYTGASCDVIMCVISRHEEFPFCELVLSLDPAAFIVIGDASGVRGNGFAEPDEITG